MTALQLVTPPARSWSGPDIAIGLVVRPVTEGYPDPEGGDIRQLPDAGGGLCAQAVRAVCRQSNNAFVISP
jgi:hypothetical protein